MQQRAPQEAPKVTVWENNHAEEAKDRLGWNHASYPDSSQGAEEAPQTHVKTPEHAAPEVPRGTRQGRRSHQPFCRRRNPLHECRFKDKTLFSFRFACDMLSVGADLSDWKTGNYDIIREYMKPIPR